MRANRSMRSLLETMDVSVPLSSASLFSPSQELASIGGSVLLVEQHRQSASVSVEDFPDRTGYECFVNHIHLPYNGTRDSLVGLLEYVAQLRRGLEQYAPERQFLIILSISGAECVVRFHECRPGERWLASDLEGYKEESILVVCVGGADADC
jgi:hypothetical protein